MRERRRANTGAVRVGAAVADQVIAIDSLGRLDHHRGLARGNYWPPTDV